MSSYFDEASGNIANFAKAPDFMKALEQEEARVARDCELLCGDREFPTEFREKILGVIATQSVAPCPSGVEKRSRLLAEAARYSAMIEKLHDIFHELASKRIKTRFGLLTDHPLWNLQRREAEVETQLSIRLRLGFEQEYSIILARRNSKMRGVSFVASSRMRSCGGTSIS